jgi:hypothetical protein
MSQGNRRLPPANDLYQLGNIMEWLSQNWIWLAFGVGMLLMMRRGGAGGCCGSMHQAPDKRAETDGAATKSAAAGGCCGGGDHPHEKDSKAEAPQNAAPTVEHQH